MSDLPEPPVPPEVDLKDFPFTPIYRARLFGSRFHARVSDAAWRAGVTLWLKSWDQVPAGSLPDDEIELCRLAELGRDLKTWRKIADDALHSWFLCTDGRLYHGVVAEGIIEAWQRKCAQRDRTEAARATRASRRLLQTSQYGETPSVTEDRRRDNVSVTEASACNGDDVTEAGSGDNASVTDSKGQRQREEKPSLSGGQKERDAAHGRTAKRRQQVPADWLPDQAGLEYAHREAGWPQARIDHELDRFRDHHRSRGNLFLDVAAAWRTWIRNGAERDKSRHSALPNFATAYADESVEHWRDRLRFWMDEKWGGPTKERWAAGAWGPPPGHAGCRVPREVLAELEAGS